MPRLARAVLMAAIPCLVLSLVTCEKESAMILRTDPEPLENRLEVPKPYRAVRWVATSPLKNSEGWTPGRTDFFEIYAAIELDAVGFDRLANVAGAPVRGHFLIPEDVAKVVLTPQMTGAFNPSDAHTRAAEGDAYPVGALSLDPKTMVEQAVRVNDALMVRFRAQ